MRRNITWFTSQKQLWKTINLNVLPVASNPVQLEPDRVRTKSRSATMLH